MKQPASKMRPYTLLNRPIPSGSFSRQRLRGGEGRSSNASCRQSIWCGQDKGCWAARVAQDDRLTLRQQFSYPAPPPGSLVMPDPPVGKACYARCARRLDKVRPHKAQLQLEAQRPGHAKGGTEAARAVGQGRDRQHLLHRQQKQRQAAGVELHKGRGACGCMFCWSRARLAGRSRPGSRGQHMSCTRCATLHARARCFPHAPATFQGKTHRGGYATACVPSPDMQRPATASPHRSAAASRSRAAGSVRCSACVHSRESTSVGACAGMMPLHVLHVQLESTQTGRAQDDVRSWPLTKLLC